jgi:hypothetical protein
MRRSVLPNLAEDDPESKVRIAVSDGANSLSRLAARRRGRSRRVRELIFKQLW